jgi:tetratricopeptide (TPR) repeat protein
MTVPGPTAVSGTVPLIWGAVPPRNRNFTGRADILARLRQETSGAVVASGERQPQALQGLGGVGKTAVAVEYSHRYRADYDLIWWIPADQLALVRSSLASLAARLGLEAAMATGIEGAAAAVLDALRRGEPYSRWLLIFDNADQPEDLNEFIPRGPGDVLITSRNHRWQAVVDTFQLDVFTREESTGFLAKRVPKRLTESEADTLAEALGDLPLALEQAGALLAETGMSVEEYLRLLEDQGPQILAEGKSPEYPLPMTVAWTLSVTTIRAQLPEALELLRCCAFFSPDPIPRDVFRSSARGAGTRMSNLGSDPILLARAIRELGRFALVRIDGRTMSIHRLVQALVRDELSADEQAAYRHEAHLLLAGAAPRDPGDVRQWSRYRELVPHVISRVTGLARCQEPHVRNFALSTLRFLSLSGDLGSCRVLAERFIEQWTEDSGPDDHAVLEARHVLGHALYELGHYREARDYNDATLCRVKEVFGERDDMTLALLNAVGADLRAHGDFAQARKFDEGIRELHVEAFGPTDPRTLRLLSDLALDYELTSNYPAARQLYEHVYRLQNEPGIGVSPTEILITWVGLARAVGLGGNYAEARDVCEEAVDYGQVNLGPEHYWTLRTLQDLSIAIRRMGADRDGALSLAREVYETFGRLFGKGHPDILAAAIGLANAQRTVGQADQALALAEGTVAGYSSTYGPDHPYRHGCAGNLALLRRVTGDLTGALRIDEEALAGLDARLSRDHRYSLTVATNLASDLAALGETARARALGDDTLARLRALLGENHPLTLGCATNLVLDLRADGVSDDAERLAATTMSRYAQTLGEVHPDVETAASGLRVNFDFDPSPV